MTPRALLELSRRAVHGSDPAMRGLWARAAALLTRQTLETCLTQIWRRRAPSLEEASYTTQLLCLPHYVRDAALAHELAHTWSALSAACHHHAYRLPPTAAELETWQRTVECLVDYVERTG